ncbi:hypothetical protein Nepgr_007975 [Nepenthes gracilis]|uniref:Uncharacterized protein n=1 Tax=Nepenthes gracilis TaxID=150966 RepID=A0AAD3XIY7_NEPGR|nr:hypothetical protein Nepgr_007975 [Nepenthes gracilis]
MPTAISSLQRQHSMPQCSIRMQHKHQALLHQQGKVQQQLIPGQQLSTSAHLAANQQGKMPNWMECNWCAVGLKLVVLPILLPLKGSPAADGVLIFPWEECAGAGLLACFNLLSSLQLVHLEIALNLPVANFGFILLPADELAAAWRILCKLVQNPTRWTIAGSCDGLNMLLQAAVLLIPA